MELLLLGLLQGRHMILMIDTTLMTWNMRGLNHPLKRHEWKRFVGKFNISCGAILETRVKSDKLVGCLSTWESSVWSFAHNCSLDKNCRVLVF